MFKKIVPLITVVILCVVVIHNVPKKLTKEDKEYIEFFIITGISKFTQVSIFSDLNNLNDISLNDKYVQMLGYTETELTHYFADHIKQLQQKYQPIYTNINHAIKDWYNGYRFGDATVYNPWSILNYIVDRPNPPSAYWINTSNNDLVYQLIQNGDHQLRYQRGDNRCEA